MASTINAKSTGSGSVETTADASGQLALQANGSTIATISSTGLAVTGTITSNGVTTSPYTMKNRIINGAMLIAQRGATSFNVDNTANQYAVDRFMAYGNIAASKFSVQQVSGNANTTQGFQQSLRATSSSAYTVASTDAFYVAQKVEGYNMADFAWGTAGAKTVTLSFWVYSSLTGTFGGSLSNNSETLTYPFSYTISSANTWEYKTITIAGPTTSTWESTNGTGIEVNFSLGAGSSRSGTAGAWFSGWAVQPTGSTSVVGTNGATWYLTGVQLELGSSATAFEWRPYGMELELCQRYYYLHASNNQTIGMGAYYTTTNVRIPINFPTTMRTSPTLYSASGTDYYQIYRNNTGDPFNTVTQDGAGVNTTTIYNNTQIAAGTVGWPASIW